MQIVANRIFKKTQENLIRRKHIKNFEEKNLSNNLFIFLNRNYTAAAQ